MNSYDWCVANKMVDGKQLTIVWHVDDLKISHRDSKVVDIMLDKLDKEYGKVGKMTIRRGAVHGYLGMRFDLSNPGKVMIDMHMHMHDYINEILQHVHDDMEGVAKHQQQNICSRLSLVLSHWTPKQQSYSTESQHSCYFSASMVDKCADGSVIPVHQSDQARH